MTALVALGILFPSFATFMFGILDALFMMGTGMIEWLIGAGVAVLMFAAVAYVLEAVCEKSDRDRRERAQRGRG